MSKRGDSSGVSDGESSKTSPLERRLPKDKPNSQPTHPDEVKLNRSLRRAINTVEAAEDHARTTKEKSEAAITKFREELDRYGGTNIVYKQVDLLQEKIQVQNAESAFYEATLNYNQAEMERCNVQAQLASIRGDTEEVATYNKQAALFHYEAMQAAVQKTRSDSYSINDEIALLRLKQQHGAQDGQETITILQSTQETLTRQASIDETNKAVADVRVSLRTTDLYNAQADAEIRGAVVAETEGKYFESITRTISALEKRLTAIKTTRDALIVQSETFSELHHETFNGTTASGEQVSYQEIVRRLGKQQKELFTEYTALFTKLYESAEDAVGQRHHDGTNPVAAGIAIFRALRSIQQTEDAYTDRETKRQNWQSTEKQISTSGDPIDDAIKRMLQGKERDTTKKAFEEAEIRWHQAAQRSAEKQADVYASLTPQVQSIQEQDWTAMTVWHYEYRLREKEQYLWLEQTQYIIAGDRTQDYTHQGIQTVEERVQLYLEHFHKRGIDRENLGSEPLNWQHIRETIEQQWAASRS